MAGLRPEAPRTRTRHRTPVPHPGRVGSATRKMTPSRIALDESSSRPKRCPPEVALLTPARLPNRSTYSPSTHTHTLANTPANTLANTQAPNHRRPHTRDSTPTHPTIPDRPSVVSLLDDDPPRVLPRAPALRVRRRAVPVCSCTCSCSSGSPTAAAAAAAGLRLYICSRPGGRRVRVGTLRVHRLVLTRMRRVCRVLERRVLLLLLLLRWMRWM